MKIIFATGIFPPDIGGPALYSQNLARQFSGAGVEVLVFAYGNKLIDSDRYRVFGVSRLWPYFFRQFVYFLKLMIHIRNSDAILAFDSLGAGLPAVLAGKLSGKKVVIRIGGDFLWEKFIESGSGAVTLPEFYGKNLQKNYPILNRLVKFVLQNSDAIIFTTEFQREIFVPHYGLDESRTFVVNNVFTKQADGISNPTDGPRTVLWAGRFIKLKNLEFLLRVFKRLSAENPDLSLKLIGSGPELNKLKVESLDQSRGTDSGRLGKFSSGGKVGGKILFINQLSEEMLADEIKKSYFCVLPSLSEVSPNFALKCLSLNKPILVTQETGIKKEFPGLMYIDPKNEESLYHSMLRLLDENTYDNYGKFISNIRSGKNWEEVSSEYLKLLK